MNAVKRGEIWLVDLGEPSSHEQAGQRPAIVLQTDDLNHLSTIVVIPLTTKPNRASFTTNVPIVQGEAGLTSDSVVLCHQIRALDRRRLMKRIGEVSGQRLSEIEAAVSFLLRLPG